MAFLWALVVLCVGLAAWVLMRGDSIDDEDEPPYGGGGGGGDPPSGNQQMQ